jgi:hypothetical protein
MRVCTAVSRACRYATDRDEGGQIRELVVQLEHTHPLVRTPGGVVGRCGEMVRW